MAKLRIQVVFLALSLVGVLAAKHFAGKLAAQIAQASEDAR